MSVIESIAPAGTWNADPVHSNVSFEVAYAGVNNFRGSFRDFNASLTGSGLEGSAKVASVDVKDEQLNGHLQTPDFFDAQRYPEIEFKATGVYRYFSVPRAVHDALLATPSPGKYFLQHIKGKFAWEKVS